MPLLDLLNKMKGEMPESASTKKDKSVNEMIDESLPSDTELQSAKAGRRQTANEVTDYLAQKGWPTAGAIAGAATDLSADLIPESRESYKEQMASSMSPVGSTSKIGKLAAKEALPTLSDIPSSLRVRMSGEELEAFVANPRLGMDKLKQQAKEAQAAAQKTIDLKSGIGISKNAKPLEEAMQFEGSQAKESRRLMDPSKKFETTQSVADIKSGALPKASESVAEPTITTPKFQEYIGPTQKDAIRLREEAARAEALRRFREGR